MKKAIITENYRDHFSKLAKGLHDLLAGEEVQVKPYCGIGNITVIKKDGKEVSITGFSGYIIKTIK